jgi:hypothetical protein
MCPRDLIEHPRLMRPETWQQMLTACRRKRFSAWSSPATASDHSPNEILRIRRRAARHPVRFDMVSNGHLLDEDKLRHLDGAIDLLIVSFSSIDPGGLPAVHVNLDQQRVMANIRRHKGCSSTPAGHQPDPDAGMPALPADTIAWLKARASRR